MRIRSLTIELCCIVISLSLMLGATFCSTANAQQSSATDQKKSLPDSPKPNNNKPPVKAPVEQPWPRTEGSTLRGDNGANKNLYGKDVSAQDIVFNKAEPVPDCTKELLATLQKASPVNKSKN